MDAPKDLKCPSVVGILAGAAAPNRLDPDSRGAVAAGCARPSEKSGRVVGGSTAPHPSEKNKQDTTIPSPGYMIKQSVRQHPAVVIYHVH